MMIKSSILTATLNIETDGDFDFKNEDKYFEEKHQFYSKNIVLSERPDLRQKELENLFEEMKKRVYNKRGFQKNLIEFIKNINLYYECYSDKEKVYPFNTNGIYTYLSGNSEIELSIGYDTHYKFENNKEKEDYELYLKLKHKFQHINKHNIVD